ncbi:hypothetical protein QQS21_006800 [Conoideocrella luteorostrata]|uniref:AA1-like domain-containing protein n=1 Tax=Conoideocrella luteorostrata TaxID=1105319 RepID=A0AAJ0CLV4_9HYPO|nr:hypothetical protein QQS21_006800 [Conoideocrella luteorostrata]
MKAASAILYALAAAVSAAPASEPKPSENIEISTLYVRKYVTGDSKRIDSVSFKLKGRDADGLDCAVSNPDFPTPNKVTTCGESKYRFTLHPGTDGSEFSLRIYHELGTAVGFFGQGNAPLYCHAGGNGAGDYVCAQVAPLTIVINNDPPPVNP